MYRAFFCLTYEHTAWAVPLAALVCWFSCLATLHLLRQARAGTQASHAAWILGAGLAAGIGIWSTHFIAMLGYDPGFGIGYDLSLTLLSLGVGVASSCTALVLARHLPGAAGAASAGAVLGLGIAAMHFTGMAGVRLPGFFTWNIPMVGVALVAGTGLAALALTQARRAAGRGADVVSATLLTGAIACLHFIAMAAVEIVPDPTFVPEVNTFPRGALALGIAAGMLTILAMSALALFVEHLHRTNRSLREGKQLLREKSELLDTVLETMDQGLMMVDSAGTVRVCNERAVALLGLPPALMRAQAAFEAVCSHLIAAGRFAHAPERLRHWSLDGIAMGKPTPSSTKARRAASWRCGSCPSRGRRRAHLHRHHRPQGRRDPGDAERGAAGAGPRRRQRRPVGFRPRDRRRVVLGAVVAGAGLPAGDLEAHARTWRMLVHPEDAPLTERTLEDHLEGRTALYECEHRMRRSDGTWAWLLTRGRVVARAEDGRPLRFVGTQIDISARKAAEGQIAHMARHDGLTDLPNRALFYDRLDERLGELRQRGGSAAVLCLDLDRFKAVNDRLGHLAGDTVLRAVAHRIRVEVHAEDVVARLGGDEFAVLVAEGGDLAAIEDLARRLIRSVNAPIPFGEQRMEVGLSIGIARMPEHGQSGEEVFKRADLALYRAKLEGRNTHRVFESAMDEAVAERRDLECDLRDAIAANELTLHYQPQMTTAGGTSWGSRRWCAGATPRAGSCRRASSCPWPRRAGSSWPSANGCCGWPAARRPAGTAPSRSP